LRSAIAAAVLLAASLAASPPHAGKCADTYDLMGRVVDTNGRPLGDVKVFLLLDEISERQFHKQGMRAVRTRTNPMGWFAERIVCGGSPDPCAGNPRHVTVLAGSDSFRMKAKVFKLKKLQIDEGPESCTVRVPELRLSPGS
jgi:hypothetical protein